MYVSHFKYYFTSSELFKSTVPFRTVLREPTRTIGGIPSFSLRYGFFYMSAASATVSHTYLSSFGYPLLSSKSEHKDGCLIRPGVGVELNVLLLGSDFETEMYKERIV